MAGKPVFEVLLEYRGEIGMLPEVKGVYDEPLPAEVGSLIAYAPLTSANFIHLRVANILMLCHKGSFSNVICH